MNIEIGALITGFVAIIAAAISYGMNKKADERAERDIAEIQKKIEGMDRWSRNHEEKEGVCRLNFTQKNSGLEKQIEIASTNHDQVMDLIRRVESAISRMDEKFDALTKTVSDFVSRRSWESIDRR